MSLQAVLKVLLSGIGESLPLLGKCPSKSLKIVPETECIHPQRSRALGRKAANHFQTPSTAPLGSDIYFHFFSPYGNVTKIYHAQLSPREAVWRSGMSVRLGQFKFCLHHLLVSWSGSAHSGSAHLSFHLCKMGRLSLQCCEDAVYPWCRARSKPLLIR